MKPTKFTLTRVPIDPGYAPGYPRSLTREEFEALLAPRNRERVLALWGAACAALAISAGGGDGADREARVLALLQREADAHRVGYGWLWSSSMVRGVGFPEETEHVYVPSIPIMFGNSSTELFDAGSARKLASEIFRAYGLECESGVILETPAVHASLDGANRERKLGFKLRGVIVRNEIEDLGEAEPSATDLDAGERAALEKDGWKLHVADVRHYRFMDGDQLTPTLAYLCGVVEFLNSVSDGPDLDLRSVLMGERLCFPVPDLKGLGLAGGESKPSNADETYQEFETKDMRTLTLRFNAKESGSPVVRARGWRAVAERNTPAAEPAPSTLGRVSALQLPFQRCEPIVSAKPGKPEPEHGPVHVTVKQPREAGAPPLVVEAWNELVFIPSSFDSAKPFELVVELQPGKYLLKSSLNVSILRE